LRLHLPSLVAQTRQTRRHSPSRVTRTRQTRTLAEPCCVDSPDSPTLAKGHFQEKYDSPQQESREFGASGHCLIKNQKKLTKCNQMSISHFNYFHYDFELTL
jgi:hypothetical protein